MLASIHPLGERARGQRYGLTAFSYVAASAVGGAAMGATLGLLGSAIFAVATPSDSAIGAILVIAAAAGLLLESRRPRSRLPSWHRQVNEDWLTTYHGWVYGAGFGFQLGLGFVTIITSAAVYLTFLLALLTGSMLGGLAVGAMFGLSRAAVALSVARVVQPAHLRAAHRRLQALTAPAQRMAGTVQAAVGVVGGVVILT